jgi:hypothetical protein
VKDVMMEQEDFLRLKDQEIASLREELARARASLVSAQQEADLLMDAARATTKENVAMRKQLQSWADDADAIIAKARRAELEALEL